MKGNDVSGGKTAVLVALLGMGGLCDCMADDKSKKDAERELVNINASTLTIVCGDISLGISEWKMWTMNGIEYKGAKLATTDSSYGTVFGFPDIGWIGAAHKDIEIEALRELTLYLDGKALTSLPARMQGESFKICKSSRIRDFALQSTVEIRNNRIHDTTVINTEKDVPLDVVYNAMYAWTPSATGVLARSHSGEELNALFDDAGRKEYSLKDLEWAAVYDSNSGKGAVSCLVDAPAIGGADLLIVNAPKVYRKYYLMSFAGQIVPAGFSGTYKMATGFFEAPAEQWQATARKRANEIRRMIPRESKKQHK
jgi:hypothetical protein